MSGQTKRSAYYAWITPKRIDTKSLVLYTLIAINALFLIYYSNAGIKRSAADPRDCVVIINSNKGVKTVENLLKNLGEKNVVTDKISARNGVINSKSEPSFRKWWSTEYRGNFSVIRNYITNDDDEHSAAVNAENSVTLTTQCTYEFLSHSPILCTRWDGPLSIGVYAPGSDLQIAINIIYYLRECAHSCVRANISWHLIYDRQYGPDLSDIKNPDSYLDHSEFDCESQSIQTIISGYKDRTTFRSDHSLTYPINVIRNVARLSSRTKYVFASDIELYPSANIVSRFLDLLDRENQGLVKSVNKSVPHVYILPTFEVDSDVKPPLTKSELKILYTSEKAIWFHKKTCDMCFRLPRRDHWFDLVPNNDSLNVFTVTKREKRKYWEPFYIGTNAEPLWDERLTWDGMRDKILQIYELCVKNYDFVILDNAFLVHTPGFKHKDKKESEQRKRYVRLNNKVYWSKLAMFEKMYGKQMNC